VPSIPGLLHGLDSLAAFIGFILLEIMIHSLYLLELS
jgi:hypothetical protein